MVPWDPPEGQENLPASLFASATPVSDLGRLCCMASNVAELAKAERAWDDSMLIRMHSSIASRVPLPRGAVGTPRCAPGSEGAELGRGTLWKISSKNPTSQNCSQRTNSTQLARSQPSRRERPKSITTASNICPKTETSEGAELCSPGGTESSGHGVNGASVSNKAPYL